MKLTLSEQNHDSTLEVNTARTVSLGMTENLHLNMLGQGHMSKKLRKATLLH